MAGPSVPPQALPVGTQVVLRVATVDAAGGVVQRGATGRITARRPVIGQPSGRDGCGQDGYEVRLADGRAVTCRRAEVAPRGALQHDVTVGAAVSRVDGAALVTDHTIFAAVVGSRAFGLATGESDTDTRGVYVAPTPLYWSLVKPPSHVDGPQPEWFSWEVERFCELALKANPNLLEVLHSPLVVVSTQLGEELVTLRPAFLSQLAYQTYSGYVLSQFKKLQADLRQRGAPRWKHVMHLLRLLLAAEQLLSTGEVRLDVGEHRDRLLAVRRGELPWEEVEKWRLALHARLDKAMERTPLPALPDVDRVDGWLHSVRSRSARSALT